MSEDSILVSKLNRSFSRGRNPSVTLLGGEIIKYDRMNKEIYMRTFMCCDSHKTSTRVTTFIFRRISR